MFLSKIFDQIFLSKYNSRAEERRHKMSLQGTLKATSTIKNASNKSARFPSTDR